MSSKNDKKAMGTPGGVVQWRREWVPVAAIIKLDAFQVRQKVDPAMVKRYADLHRQGTEFPPVKVAQVGSKTGPLLYLVDGWHRMEAGALQLRREGFDNWDVAGDRVLVDLAELTTKQAQWAAAQANTTHGLPLKASEARNVFRAFVKSGQHRQDGRYLSYREMAPLVGIGRAHTTLRNWMQKDFPATFKHIGGTEQGNWDANGQPGTIISQEELHAQQARDSLAKVAQVLPLLDASGRQEMAQLLRAALVVAEQDPSEATTRTPQAHEF